MLAVCDMQRGWRDRCMEETAMDVPGVLEGSYPSLIHSPLREGVWRGASRAPVRGEARWRRGWDMLAALRVGHCLPLPDKAHRRARLVARATHKHVGGSAPSAESSCLPPTARGAHASQTAPKTCSSSSPPSRC